jgi:hypothetical protein
LTGVRSSRFATRLYAKAKKARIPRFWYIGSSGSSRGGGDRVGEEAVGEVEQREPGIQQPVLSVEHRGDVHRRATLHTTGTRELGAIEGAMHPCQSTRSRGSPTLRRIDSSVEALEERSASTGRTEICLGTKLPGTLHPAPPLVIAAAGTTGLRTTDQNTVVVVEIPLA